MGRSSGDQILRCCLLSLTLAIGISSLPPPGEEPAPYAPRIYPEAVKSHYAPLPRTPAYYRQYEEKGPYPGPQPPKYPPPDRCIVTDLFLTMPPPPAHGGPKYGHGPFEPRKTPSYSTSAAIPDYSDFNRPSYDVLSHSGYSPNEMSDAGHMRKGYEYDSCPAPGYDEPVDCHRFIKYRSFDGSCNNLKYPSWGNRTQPYSRITARTYSDGKDMPRLFSVVKEYDDKLPLPNPRVLSVMVSQNKPYAHPVANLLMPYFAQIIGHDLTLTPSFQVNNRQPDCCVINSDCQVPECFQFSIPPYDPFYSRFNITCHQFARSLPSKDARCRYGVREQFTTVTHWLDASPVYGSNDDQSLAIRNFYKGQLSFRDVNSGIPNDQYTEIFLQILPSLPPHGPSSCRPLDPRRTCFLAGDERVNQTPLLAAIQTMFLRYHNHIANFMAAIYPDWSDEVIFQETRRIVIASYQVIVYKEFLPVLLGEKIANHKRYAIKLEDEGYFDGYDETYDPHVINEFTTAAFRLHTLVADVVPRLLFSTGPPEAHLLSTQFNNQTLLYEDGNTDAIVNGMLEEMALGFDRQVSLELQGRLFRGRLPFGLDLVSIDIQRGRDHGLGTYNDIREACGYGRAYDFADLKDFIPYENIAILQKTYRSVDDIDLMVGGLMESPVNGEASVGPTFACVIALEFRGKRVADRFWHENPDQFSPDQLQQLHKSSMAQMICATTELRSAPWNSFLDVSEINPLVPCKMIPRLDLYKFFGVPKPYGPSEYNRIPEPYPYPDTIPYGPVPQYSQERPVSKYAG
ncbi:Peroxidase [Hypsibius exemplaris]|uniref:Peroxidase n=1 Tax=Hypsibius exemplaris TaxID=2072580 RepID=A0A1W0XEW8_HYPEX|nr:Peroxidase [Hypsibius exemplaris]